MKRWSWLAVVALVMVPMVVVAVNDVRFGTTEAYWYPDGTVRVPVLVSNDLPIHAWGIAFRIPSGSQVIDSVTSSGRGPGADQVIIGVVANANCTNSPDGTPIDSGYLLLALRPQSAIAAGSGEICSIWLHGLPLGSNISFDLPSSLSSADPENCVAGQITKFISTTFEDLIPVTISSNLTVVDAPLVVDVPVAVTGSTLKEVRIPVSIASYFGQSTVSVIGFVGPNGPTEFPAVTGSGPWDIVFTPGLHGQGAYLLTVRASNEHGQSAEKSVAIAIVNSVLSGDIDCNGNVDLSDLTRMINWLLTHTLPPVCP